MEPLKDMPKDYVLCPATDAACPRAATCLRAHAWRTLAAGREKGWTFVRSLSPALAINPPSPCPHYRNSTPVRLARGMSHLFDDVPRRLALSVRRQVVLCFSSERYFYYCRGGKRLITPEEQQAVAAVFKRAGLSFPPKFDSYEEGYNW